MNSFRPLVNRTIVLDVEMLSHVVLPIEDCNAPVFTLPVRDGDNRVDLLLTYDMYCGVIIVRHPNYACPFFTIHVSQLPHQELRYSTISWLASSIRVMAYKTPRGEMDDISGEIDIEMGDRVDVAWDAELSLSPALVGYGYLNWYDASAEIIIDMQAEPSSF